MEAMGGPPLTVGDYLRELVARLRTALGDELLGVYAGGSFALGDFDQSLSDLDVAAVTATHAGRTTKQAIVELLRHESLPCPARVSSSSSMRSPSSTRRPPIRDSSSISTAAHA